MWGRKKEKVDPKEEAITRLIKGLRRQHDEFIRLLIAKDRLRAIGASLEDTERILKQLDRDMTANEQQLKSLGYLPKHREVA